VSQVREIKAGSSYLGQSDLRVHFGLGQAAQADRIEIRWPGGGSWCRPFCPEARSTLESTAELPDCKLSSYAPRSEVWG